MRVNRGKETRNEWRWRTGQTNNKINEREKKNHSVILITFVFSTYCQNFCTCLCWQNPSLSLHTHLCLTLKLPLIVSVSHSVRLCVRHIPILRPICTHVNKPTNPCTPSTWVSGQFWRWRPQQSSGAVLQNYFQLSRGTQLTASWSSVLFWRPPERDKN